MKTQKPWSEMTRRERRVAVAIDVLAQLDAKKFKATGGLYIHEEGAKSEKDFGCRVKRGHKCRACGIGGVMLAHMRLTSNNPGKSSAWIWISRGSGSWNRYIGPKEIRLATQDCFTENQLVLIEDCFESGYQGSCWRHANIWSSNLVDRARRRGYAKDGPRTGYELRLRGIMGNIIRNKGDFRVSDGPIFVSPQAAKPKKIASMAKRAVASKRGRAAARK